MVNKNALPPGPIIAALNAVQTATRFAKLVEYVATRTFTAGHDAIAAAIHFADHHLLAEHRQEHWIDPELQAQALDNLARQVESEA